MKQTYIIAEIGINHQGDLNIAKRLIDIAAASGCDAVKFQKRNPDICVPEEQKSKPRSWQGEKPVNDIIYDYLESMGLTADVPHARLSESHIRRLIIESIARNIQ